MAFSPRNTRYFLALILMASPAIAQPPPPVCTPLDNGLTAQDVRKRPYTEYVRDCIDLLLDRGTDRYGKVQSPMLMNIIDVRDGTCPQNPLPLEEEYRVTRHGRRGPAGGNLYPDQRTYRVMFALSRLSGNAKYADFAKESLHYYLGHLVDDKGLIWWGWHRHYDAYTDQMTGHNNNYHEIHFQEAQWPMLWEIDPAVVKREIEAIWEWHLVDKKTGEINRHSDAKRGCNFAFTGGEIVNAFAFMYGKTHDPQWMNRAKLVADYYWSRRDPKTNLIPTTSIRGEDRFDGSTSDTATTGAMCPRLLRASEYAGQPVFREQALTYLAAYQKYAWDEKTGDFWQGLLLDGKPIAGPVPKDEYGKYQPRNHVYLWQPYAAGYELPIQTAQTYAWVADLTHDASFEQTAKRWASLMKKQWPPAGFDEPAWYDAYKQTWATHGTYAEYYGRAISFLLQMQHNTGDAGYLDFARTIADEALAKLEYKGWLRGHPCKPYYESMDGVGYLMYALLQLDETLHPPDTRVTEFGNW